MEAAGHAQVRPRHRPMWETLAEVKKHHLSPTGTHRSWGLEPYLAELGHSMYTCMSKQEVGYVMLGHSTTKPQKKTGSGGRFYREIVGLPLWDCNTQIYMES